MRNGPDPTSMKPLVAFNGGLTLVVFSLFLPWAEVAGRPRSGPAFANLLLSLPEIPLLGSHLTLVARLWYTIPLLALGVWVTQFGSWPPRASRWSRWGALLLGAVVSLLVAWLAIRGVGFPAAGPLLAGAGALVVVVATWVRDSVPATSE